MEFRRMFFFFQAEDGIRDIVVTGVQTCALPIWLAWYVARAAGLYAAQGLNVEILNMNGGSRGAEELQAARIDVMHVGLSSVVKVNQAGGNLGVVGSVAT